MKTKLLLVLLLFITHQLSAQWVQQNSGVNSNLYSINFINSNTGFCVGTDNVILKTTNAGNNWISISSPVSVNAFGYVKMFSADSVVIGVKDSSIVIKTTNGGLNWSVYTATIIPASYTKIKTQFTDFQNGFILTSSNLYATTNGGNNWVSKSSSTYRDMSFVNENTGWTACKSTIPFPPPSGTSYSQIRITTNGGINWTTQISIQEASYSIYRVFAVNSSILFHNDFSNACIMKSDDQGYGWIGTYGAGPYKNYYSMCFPSLNTGWFIGNKIIRSTNAGINWTDINVPNGSIYNSVFFIDDNTGWMAGASGIIIKTNTGGVTNINSVSNELPDSYKLYQNYPNPFNPNSKIKFSIPNSGLVKLTVYNMEGKEITTLINQSLVSGSYEVDFNGEELSSGIYLYRLSAGQFSETRKMMLIK